MANGTVLYMSHVRLVPGELEYKVNRADDRMLLVDEGLHRQVVPQGNNIPCVERLNAVAIKGGSPVYTNAPRGEQ